MTPPGDDREPVEPPADWTPPPPVRRQTKVETVTTAKVGTATGARARRRR